MAMTRRWLHRTIPGDGLRRGRGASGAAHPALALPTKPGGEALTDPNGTDRRPTRLVRPGCLKAIVASVNCGKESRSLPAEAAPESG